MDVNSDWYGTMLKYFLSSDDDLQYISDFSSTSLTIGKPSTTRLDFQQPTKTVSPSPVTQPSGVPGVLPTYSPARSTSPGPTFYPPPTYPPYMPPPPGVTTQEPMVQAGAPEQMPWILQTKPLLPRKPEKP